MHLTALKVSALLISLFFTPVFLLAQVPGNNECSNATLLTSATTCVTTNGNVTGATNSNIAANALCNGTADDDVWFRFIAQESNATVSLSGMDNSGNPSNSLGKGGAVIEMFYAAGTGCPGTYVACNSGTGTSLNLITSGLVKGGTYYVRVYSMGAGTVPTNGAFKICITHVAPLAPPANDACAAAIPLTLGASAISGTVSGATNSSVAASPCTGTPDDDVWYRFTATANAATVTLNVTGAALNSMGAQLQAFSGTCGNLVSKGCSTSPNTLSLTGLTPGESYLVRVYGSGTGSINTNASDGAFTIKVAVPLFLPPSSVAAGRMNEVFQQTILSGAGLLNDPWEITYGPDGYLWITEAKGYKLYRMDPNTGTKTTVLDVAQGSTFLPAAQQSFNVQFSSTQNPWPQGGFAGMALHPKFLDATDPKNYVYVSYVHSYQGQVNGANNGEFFTNRIVRFYYNTTTGRCENPVSLCDTLPGSSDHNSQRMIVAPVGGTNYLFYASGDMGAGQFSNANRPIRSQIDASYEGKILRFNLDEDNDEGAMDRWIPNDNPFNSQVQSAVWSTGIRNNQGFAYATINGVGYLYGGSHGPFSDDELNIIERAKNYGHPLVIGFAADGNYNGFKAGSATGSMPTISSEAANAAAIGSGYRDPIFSAYAAPNAKISTIYSNQTNNGAWPSEGWSGLDIYTNSIIPGWKNSLVIGSLKWGRVLRLKLNSTGNAIVPSGQQDTVGYFGSTNRFRDVAIGPNGKELFVIMDKSSTTSGPTANNPVVSACAGCVHKYTFLGYQSTEEGKSNIPSFVGISTGGTNTCIAGNQITINSANNNLWVPITGPDGNVLAEIRANGNNLGTVTASAYLYSGTPRQTGDKKLYGNRSLTITPQNQPTTPVSIRLYLTSNEYQAMQSATNQQGRPSGISSISDISILKNNDPCGSSMVATPAVITPVFAEAHGSVGYVLQGNISGFSSFYFGNPNMEVLPLQLLALSGSWNSQSVLLKWKTANESNTSLFEVERSTDGQNYRGIGSINAAGNSTETIAYSFNDAEASGQNAEVIYYRLKMIDMDGSFSYSNVVNVSIPEQVKLIVFPSPVEHTLNIRMSHLTNKLVKVSIVDVQGREVYRSNLTTLNGQIKVDVKSWKSQLYLIRIINHKNEVIAVQKFQKL